MTVQLYDDQADLVHRVRQAMRRHKSVLMQASTGAGKTRMALDMIGGAHAKGSTAVFSVPRRELLAQTIETISGYGIPFGVISPDHSYNPLAPIQIAMTPTLARRLDRITPPKVLFIDECHYGGAELESVIAWSVAGGGWRVGLSATPYKTNGRPMGDWYETMEMGLPVADLIQRGRLSDFRYFAPSAPDLSAVKSRDGEYVQSQLASYMEQETAIIGDAVRTYREHADGLLNVVFATSRKHAEIIRDAFVSAGITAMTIDGTMDAATRRRIILGFARREFTILISVLLLTFGFDLAQAAGMDVTVEAMSDLCPTKSLPLQMQKWGRVLRMKPYPAIIMDHANNWREHGFPDSPREWSLDGAQKRNGQSERADPVRQCDIGSGGCGFVHRPAPVCPNCGRVYPVQSRMVDEKEGDLKEIDRAAMEAQRKAARRDQGQSETLDDLLKLAARTGKKPAWAHHVWRAREAKRRAG